MSDEAFAKKYRPTTSVHKFKLGEPLLPPQELAKSGIVCQWIHEMYMEWTASGHTCLPYSFKKEHLLCRDDYCIIDFHDLFDLYNFNMVDGSMMRCFTLLVPCVHIVFTIE